MTEPTSLPLRVGEIVVLVADPSRTGVITQELHPLAGSKRFRVFHSEGMTRDYSEDQIRRKEGIEGEDWSEGLPSGDPTPIAEFRARLTAYRLTNPQLDSIYSLMSARIKFIPFQFKPLLKLLKAERPRLLIADDVGVGKTIEAGLILKELSARQQVDRVLVLCPKALTGKWRTEMRRFDESFRVLTSESLRYCINESFLDGEWPAEYSRAIVNYELFRMEQFLEGAGESKRRLGILELDPPAQFDVVIADEAHHFRNRGTSSYRLIEHLSLASQAVLFLTATPVQVRSDDLFTLLNLLRPDLFPDRLIFEEMVEPNRFISTAVRYLRGGSIASPTWQTDALDCLVKASSTHWGSRTLKSSPDFNRVLNELSARDLSDGDRVIIARDVEDFHTLASVMNRTRRRDIGGFTLRDPHTVSVPFADEQRSLYESVLDFRRQVLLQEHDPRVVNLILDTLQRQAASCINALAATVETILSSGGIPLELLTDVDEADVGLQALPTSLLSAARTLLDAASRVSQDDPKFDELLNILENTMSDDQGPGKILVFSFFLKTIAYLHSRLAGLGYRVGVITGRVHDEERETLRDRFRLERTDPMAVDVLISSEVGCEGLDYEFCDRLVNYDIPWNPMRIEQRIGRIDRFGQKSDKVMIFNFITPETVE